MTLAMNFCRLSLLAALVFNAVVCHAAAAQNAPADRSFEDVPAYHVMKRGLSSIAKYLGKPLSPAASSADNAAAFSFTATKQRQAAKHLASSNDKLSALFVRQQNALMKSEATITQATNQISRLQGKTDKASLRLVKKAKAAKNDATKAAAAQFNALQITASRLNSGVAKAADAPKGTGKAGFEAGPPPVVRKVGFKPGPPQVVGGAPLTKAESDMVAAQLDLKNLKLSLQSAETTVKFNTPAAQASIAKFAAQRTKTNDATIAFEKSNKAVADLKRAGASPQAIRNAEEAQEAARSTLKAEELKSITVMNSLPPQLLATHFKNDRLAAGAIKSGYVGDFVPGLADIAGTKVVKESVANANVKQLKLDIARAETRLADATAVVKKEGGNPNVLQTSKQLNPQRALDEWKGRLRDLNLEKAKVTDADRLEQLAKDISIAELRVAKFTRLSNQ